MKSLRGWVTPAVAAGAILATVAGMQLRRIVNELWTVALDGSSTTRRINGAWRLGRHNRRIAYCQAGDTASDDDEMVAVFCDVVHALAAVEAVNRERTADEGPPS